MTLVAANWKLESIAQLLLPRPLELTPHVEQHKDEHNPSTSPPLSPPSYSNFSIAIGVLLTGERISRCVDR